MISVIIPAYNSAATLGACLQAIQKQDYRGKKEVIVMDDGSTDRTAAVAQQFRGVKLLAQKHAGPAAARNRGARAARGEIILFTDADCIPSRDWMREMASPFADAAVAGVQGAYRTGQRELVARFSQLEIEDRYNRMLRFPRIDFIGTYAAAYRKKAFLEFGGFDESFPSASGEDSELSFRLAEAGHQMVFAPTAVVSHRHPSSLAHYLRVKFWRAHWRVLLYRKHRGKMASESYTPQTLKLQIALFFLLLASLLSGAWLFSLAIYLVWLLATAPFSLWAFRRDKVAGMASPFILQLRSLVFGMGLVHGLLRRAA